ncbi:MAG TPA: translation initiation factor IF-2 [Candidatus Saccharimonadales bacterium]|nr:translation initiation factor IF-2 [Candidatus Saccharimonadales bacterium]
MAQTIEISDHITVGTLAEQLTMPVSRLITELMKNGVMATVNERIDFDTAQIIIDELGMDVELVKQEAAQKIIPKTKKVYEDLEKTTSRPPVVAVMGHVDHGKTSLLDAIRGAKVAESEAGGITQHITAYQVEHNNRAITFLDTPGHEAFAAIREHGAHLTDIVVIVIAADDGVKPQTSEAIRFARKAGSKIIVAINKIDKAGADQNKIKQQLSDDNLLIEEWGGDIVVVPVSAKTKDGIDNLLDMILLVSDVEDLRAENDLPATGLIIESHTQKGRGPVAHALVENGTMKRGDYIVAGSTYAKIRNLETPDGKVILTATPSTPVVITGFKTLPEFGDEFETVENERLARSKAQDKSDERQSGSGRSALDSTDLIKMINRSNKLTTFDVVIKADVQGSLTSVSDSLKALATDEVAVRVVGSGVGVVNENDIHLAHTTDAVIYAFNIEVPANIRRLANRDKVVIREYKVIYELIDNAKEELTRLLTPDIVETELAKMKVKGIFNTTKTAIICGGEITKGKLSLPATARITRGKEKVGEAEVTNLKKGAQDVNEVNEGEMCGISLKTDKKLELLENDSIEFLRRETVERKL